MRVRAIQQKHHVLSFKALHGLAGYLSFFCHILLYPSHEIQSSSSNTLWYLKSSWFLKRLQPFSLAAPSAWNGVLQPVPHRLQNPTSRCHIARTMNSPGQVSNLVTITQLHTHFSFDSGLPHHSLPSIGFLGWIIHCMLLGSRDLSCFYIPCEAPYKYLLIWPLPNNNKKLILVVSMDHLDWLQYRDTSSGCFYTGLFSPFVNGLCTPR